MRGHEHPRARSVRRALEGAVRPTARGPNAVERLLALQRLAGNTAATRALRPPPSAPAAPASEPPVVAVQRAAWASNERVDPSEPALTPAMQNLAEDELVHDYRDQREFHDHAEGRTDYLGNLQLEDTWLRFSPTGLNVTGETHTAVWLADVVRAVGTRSFIYEMFPVDDLSSNPATAASFRHVAAEQMEDLGVGEDEDVRQFGAESLFPKLGRGYTVLLPLLSPTGLQSLHTYDGMILQRQIKLGWAYAGEVHSTVQNRRQQSAVVRATARLSGRRRAQDRLAATYASQRVLGEFVDGLQPDVDLGRSLPQWTAAHPDEADRLFEELRGFARDLIALMREKVSEDPVLNLADRVAIGRRRGDAAKFAHWRNLEFRKNVLAAQKRGVRYAGMGASHSDFLRHALRREPGLYFYDLGGADMERDKAITRMREEEMRRTVVTP